MTAEYGLRCAACFAGDNIRILLMRTSAASSAPKRRRAILTLCIKVGGAITGEHEVGVENGWSASNSSG
jgi:hypothetical protein